MSTASTTTTTEERNTHEREMALETLKQELSTARKFLEFHRRQVRELGSEVRDIMKDIQRLEGRP